MNQSISKLMEAMRRALRDDILPQLNTDHARSQIAGVMDILGKIDRMIAWSPDALREQLVILEEGYATIAARATESGFIVPVAPSSSASALMNQVDLEQAVRTGEQQLAALTDWLFDPANALPLELRAELDAQLRGTLRASLLVERKLIPRADFAAMTASTN